MVIGFKRLKAGHEVSIFFDEFSKLLVSLLLLLVDAFDV